MEKNRSTDTTQQINEAVARKLGWIIYKTSDYQPWYGRPNGRPESAMIRELPDYCHSIEAAWEIVEAGHIDGVHRLDHNLWQAHQAGDNLSNPITGTAPMAICLAFLKLGDI